MTKDFFKQTFYTLGEAFHNCLRRFPVTVCFVFALTGYLIFLTSLQKVDAEEKLLFIWGYYLSVGTLLSLTLHLWCEESPTPSVMSHCWRIRFFSIRFHRNSLSQK